MSDYSKVCAMSDKKPTCFVAMPITTAPELIALYANDENRFAHVLDHLFSPAVSKSGYDIIRPATTGADVIHATIIRNLEEADLVLCDISQHNPNVFFELGIRTALDRPVVLVKDDKTEKLPFDTSIINTYTYNAALNPWSLENQIVGISEHISASVVTAGGKNALWRYFGLTQRAEVPARSDDPTGAKIDLILDEIKSLRRYGEELTPSSVTSDEQVLSNFMREALASSGYPSGQKVGRFPRRFQPLLKDLAEIAARIDARVRVVVLEDAEIVLDTGPFALTPPALKEMTSRAAREGLKLTVTEWDENLIDRALKRAGKQQTE